MRALQCQYGWGSAGVPPAVFVSATRRKTAGEMLALPNPATRSKKSGDRSVAYVEFVSQFDKNYASRPSSAVSYVVQALPYGFKYIGLRGDIK
jgi:hypothetical protein